MGKTSQRHPSYLKIPKKETWFRRHSISINQLATLSNYKLMENVMYNFIKIRKLHCKISKFATAHFAQIDTYTFTVEN